MSSAVKPVGKPDALIGHVRFDERGWETGRRFGVSARAHPRLHPLMAFDAAINFSNGREPHITSTEVGDQELLPVN